MCKDSRWDNSDKTVDCLQSLYFLAAVDIIDFWLFIFYKTINIIFYSADVISDD